MARILHVNKLGPHHPGGVERVVRDITEGLRGEHEMRVLACGRGGGNGVLEVPPQAILFSMPLSTRFYSCFRRLAREADLVHFHHPFPLGEIAGLLDGLRGRRVVVSYHSDIVRQSWAVPLYRPVLRAFLRRCDRILVNWKPLDGWSSKCVAIPYGVRPPSRAEEFPLPDRFVLFVGRLVAYKGVEHLIRAMRLLDAPLVIAGDGPLRTRLEALAGGRARFLGRVSDARLQHCYARCALLVLPSVGRNESFGLVQLEAMAHGKPVVNTRLPTAVPEVSPHDVTGLTVPVGDSVALAEAVRTILRDPARRERYAKAALARAGEFSMDRFLDRVRSVYRELLG